MDCATLAVTARTCGTAFSAGVLPGFPALSPVRNCTVRPSGLTRFPLAR